jgi:hypothetical protein
MREEKKKKKEKAFAYMREQKIRRLSPDTP